MHWASQVATVVKNPPANAGHTGSIPGSGRSPGAGHGNPFQYSCLENPMDRGAWQATVQGVAYSRIWLKWLSMQACDNKVPQSGQLKKQTFIIWQFQKLDVQDQAVSSIGFFWGFSTWSSTAPSARASSTVFPLHLSLPRFLLLIRTQSYWIRAHPRDPILAYLV